MEEKTKKIHMGNYDFRIRAKRWCKYLANYLREKVRGLDFSMVYVGDLQHNTDEYHDYSMTDASDLKKMLRAVTANARTLSFLDVGCGKGMCLKCAAELGHKKVAGLDLDTHCWRLPVEIWQGRLCDALSTSFFVMGLDKAIEYWQQRRNFDMLLITEGEEVYLTEGVADLFILNRDRSNVKVNVIKDE